MYKILIADQDKKDLQQLSETLQGEGYSIETVTQGSRAIQKVLTTPIDVMITGVDLSEMKAYETIPIIRGIDSRIIVIVTLSSDGSLETLKRIRLDENPVFFYAVKPLDVEEMKEVVRSALKRIEKEGK